MCVHTPSQVRYHHHTDVAPGYMQHIAVTTSAWYRLTKNYLQGCRVETSRFTSTARVTLQGRPGQATELQVFFQKGIVAVWCYTSTDSLIVRHSTPAPAMQCRQHTYCPCFLSDIPRHEPDHAYNHHHSKRDRGRTLLTRAINTLTTAQIPLKTTEIWYSSENLLSNAAGLRELIWNRLEFRADGEDLVHNAGRRGSENFKHSPRAQKKGIKTGTELRVRVYTCVRVFGVSVCAMIVCVVCECVCDECVCGMNACVWWVLVWCECECVCEVMSSLSKCDRSTQIFLRTKPLLANEVDCLLCLNEELTKKLFVFFQQSIGQFCTGQNAAPVPVWERKTKQQNAWVCTCVLSSRKRCGKQFVPLRGILRSGWVWPVEGKSTFAESTLRIRATSGGWRRSAAFYP